MMFTLPPMLPDGHKNPEILIHTQDATFSFPNGNSVSLPNIKQKFHRLLVIKGSIGSGKTLLLKALAGLISPTKGLVSVVTEKELKAFFVHAQGEYNFVTGNIGDEMDFAGIPRGIFDEFEKRKLSELSGGELKRISEMMALGADNDFLLLDEPLDMLDDNQAEKMADYIITYANIKPIIIATHDDLFDSHADAVIQLDDAEHGREAIRLSDTQKDVLHLETKALTVVLKNKKLPQLDLKLHEGELVCLYGANGSGKTLLVREISGIGRYAHTGDCLWHIDRADIGVCLQFPEQMIYRERISEEIAEMAGEDKVAAVLDALGWQDRADKSPFSLSDGEKREMYLLSIMLSKKCCIFDEPFAGLDSESIERLIKHFTAVKSRACSILYTSNRRYDMLFADTVVRI